MLSSKTKFFSLSNASKKQYIDNLKLNHQVWKDKNFDMKKPFFPIHSDFSNLILKDISGAALKLYIFLGIHAKYQSGESWYSIPEVSEYFGKDPRTVAKWLQELEDFHLIIRVQKGFKMKANTFLRPYGYNITINKETTTNIEKTIRPFLTSLISTKNEIKQILILDYQYEEFSFVVIYQDTSVESQLFECMSFLSVPEAAIIELKSYCSKFGFSIDNIDIPSQLSKNPNKTHSIIYSAILNYYDKKDI